MSDWYYKNKIFKLTDDKYYGFVYKITCINKLNKYFNFFYIGKKNFFTNRKQNLSKKELIDIKDKRLKKYKIITKESNWLNYNSSNKELIELIKLNKNDFKKEILYLCRDKKDLTYLEVKSQFEYKCLESNNCFNSNILGIFFKKN